MSTYRQYVHPNLALVPKQYSLCYVYINIYCIQKHTDINAHYTNMFEIEPTTSDTKGRTTTLRYSVLSQMRGISSIITSRGLSWFSANNCVTFIVDKTLMRLAVRTEIR